MYNAEVTIQIINKNPYSLRNTFESIGKISLTGIYFDSTHQRPQKL